MNLYAYVGIDPVNATDPTGMCPFCIPVVIFIAKEVAGEAFEQTTGLPAPTVKGAAKAVGKAVLMAGGKKQAADSARAAATARGRASETRKLTELGANKNTEKASTSSGNRIRDGTKEDGTHVEIKDTKRLDNTPQLRGLDEDAGKAG